VSGVRQDFPRRGVVPSPVLDGARVLWRRWYDNTSVPAEGFVREFSLDRVYVRISKTDGPYDAGVWWTASLVRIVAVLDPGKAPARKGDEEGDG
jgi:hypothetical protein